MSRLSRNIPDKAYKALHESGAPVPNFWTKPNIENMDDLSKFAIEVQSDDEDLFDAYDEIELFDEDSLSTYQSKIETVKQNFLKGYAQLKANEGEE